MNKMSIRNNDELLLLQELLLHCDDNPYNIGLFHGKMGYILVLSHYGRVRKFRFLTHVANMLIEQLTTKISIATPIGLANGLAGIGWGIEYLLQHRFIKGSASTILHDINNQIMQTDIMRIPDNGLENGFLGILHYIALHYQEKQDSSVVSFDSRYIADVKKRAKLSELPETQMLVQCIDNRVGYTPQLIHFIDAAALTHSNLSLKNGIAGKLEILLS